MSVERPALLPLIFIEKAIARFGYVRAMAFVVEEYQAFSRLRFSSSTFASTFFLPRG